MLGVFGYHHMFIPGYANIVHPINDLLKKDALFEWTESHTTAMDQLAHAVATNPVLQWPNYKWPFFLEVDASQFATGAVLSQKDDQGWLRPVGSMSHSFNQAEWNYNIHDQELLAIIHGLHAWRHILLSTPYIITIYTDHKNLTFYRSAHQIMRRVVWYLEELADYYFTLVHKPGTLNCADAFSWRLDHDTGISDNKDVVVLGLELFTNAMKLLDLKQNVFATQEEHGKWIEELQKDFLLDRIREKWFHRGRPVVSEIEELWRQLLQQYHDRPLAGHPGIANTMANLARDFWWLTLK